MGNHNPPQGGKKFSSDYQPAKKGRKPSRLKKYIKDIDLSSDDLSLIIKNVIMTKNQDQLAAIVADPREMMVVRLFVKAFLADFKKGSLVNYETLIQRAFGKPDQNINANINNTNPAADIPREERDRMLKELLTKQGWKKDESDDTD